MNLESEKIIIFILLIALFVAGKLIHTCIKQLKESWKALVKMQESQCSTYSEFHSGMELLICNTERIANETTVVVVSNAEIRSLLESLLERKIKKELDIKVLEKKNEG